MHNRGWVEALFAKSAYTANRVMHHLVKGLEDKIKICCK